MRSGRSSARRNPNFAIVKIPENADVIRFYQLLLENGFNEVSFVNEVRENAFLPYAGGEMTNGGELSKDSSKTSTLKTATYQMDLRLGDGLQKPALFPDDHFTNGMFANGLAVQPTQTTPPSTDGKVHINVGPNINDIISAALHRRDALSISEKSVNNAPLPSGSLADAAVNTMFTQLMNSASESNNHVGSKIKTRGSRKTAFHKDANYINLQTQTSTASGDSSNGDQPKCNNELMDASLGADFAEPASEFDCSADATEATLAGVASLFAQDAGGEAGTANFTSTGPNTSLDDDGNAYATCLLCQNKIMSSRLSNLTNHVRRHASLKQYQCTQCNYTHNEQAKVRLHMNHNHEDFTSQPVDRLCFEMQLQWNQLMEQCFPEHAKRSKDSEYWKSATLPSSSAKLAASTGGTTGDDCVQRTHACTSCGEILTSEGALAHIRDRHHTSCVMFACTNCGYKSTEQRYARVHASVKHSGANTRIEALPPGYHELFMKRYFPTLLFVPGDSSERVLDKGETFACKLCGNAFSASPVALLVHAKKHCIAKQYHCTDCDYASTDRKSARTHMQTCHNTEREPFDGMCNTLKNAWIDTLKKCFPDMNMGSDGYNFTDWDFRKDAGTVRYSGRKSSVQNNVETSEGCDDSAASVSGTKSAANDRSKRSGMLENGKQRRFSQLPNGGKHNEDSGTNSEVDGKIYQDALTPRETLRMWCAANEERPSSRSPADGEDSPIDRKESFASSSSAEFTDSANGASVPRTGRKMSSTKRTASESSAGDENLMPTNKSAKTKVWNSVLESEEDEEDYEQAQFL